VSWLYNNGDDYGAYLPPAGDTAPASGSDSVVRLSRHGATWTGYYLSNNNWVPIASGLGPTSDIALGPGISNNSGVAPFGGSATLRPSTASTRSRPRWSALTSTRVGAAHVFADNCVGTQTFADMGINFDNVLTNRCSIRH